MSSISIFEEEKCPPKNEDFTSCATVNSYNYDAAPPKYEDIRRLIDRTTQLIDSALHI